MIWNKKINSNSNLAYNSLRVINFCRLSSISGWNMRVDILPMLSDNYCYVVSNNVNQSLAVDPVEPAKLISHLQAHKLDLQGILITHHHVDHAGGNEELLEMNVKPRLPILGSDNRIPGQSRFVKHGEMVKDLLPGIEISCLSTPGHTTGSMSFLLKDESESDDPGCVFTGDALFLAGCGRFFEGTPLDMDSSLNGILGNLHPNTKVYCGHEYTESNLKFAAAVEPSNQDIRERMEKVRNLRALNKPTVPGLLAEELLTNPFMRTRLKQQGGINELVKSAGGISDPIQLMEKLREMKNSGSY